VKSSSNARIRNSLPSVSVSDTTSSDKRWFGSCGQRHRRPRPQRPPRRRTCSRSSAYDICCGLG
jgi:hypothetical protein